MYLMTPKHCSGSGIMYKCISNNDLFFFFRLETIRFFHLFTLQGDMEYSDCGNTEHRGIKARVLP
jgi:hypothetical protein